MTSRLERTTTILRQRGIKYWKVEYLNYWAKKTIDLFNIIDILALDGGCLGIQVCGSDYQDHVRKLTVDEAENTRAWLEAGGRIEIWAWRKVKKVRGQKIMVWKPRVADVLMINEKLVVEERE